MRPTKLTLELLSNTESLDWLIPNDASDIFQYKFSIGDDWQSISKDELDTIDPRLSHVVVKLAEDQTEYVAGRYAEGRCVGQTLRFWQSSPIFLEPAEGFSPQYIIAVDEVNPIDEEDDTISFVAIVGETDTVGDITYVKAIQRYLLTESVEWFERNYPGGRGRLIAGFGLGLPQKELTAYVFNQHAQLSQPENLVLPGQIVS